MFEFPPGLLLLAGALLVLVLPARARPVAALGAAGLVMGQLVFGLETGDRAELEWLGFTITPLRVDELSLVFGYAFGIVMILGSVYALHVRNGAQLAAGLAYGASALGVVFAGDLLTLVLAWEVMALASAYLVLSGGRPRSRQAGIRYLFVHVTGGTVLLGGVLWHLGETGSLEFTDFSEGTAAWLILLGFAINAAIPPLHAWLSDAYPEASVTGTIFLSAFTTKTAVYVLARGFAGWEVLVVLGVAMSLYGVIYAVLENDTRRLLSYHIISQVGFMVAAVGIGTEEGVNAASAHAFAHILYKGLMLMSAGAVLYATGKSRMSDLGGLGGGQMRALLVLYMIGGLAISAFPLFSGFTTKALVIDAAEMDHRLWVVFLLYVASVGTFLHTGLKLPYFTWFGGRAPETPAGPRVPAGMYAAMVGAAFFCIGLGVYPAPLYDLLPYAVDYEAYTASHIVHTLQLMTFTGLAFWLFLELLRPHAEISLDTDWFYRKARGPVNRLILEPVEQVFRLGQVGLDRATYSAARFAEWPSTAPQPVRLGVSITLILLAAGITIVWSAAW